MKKSKNIFLNIIASIIFFISLASIAMLVYFKSDYGSKYVPKAITSTYVTEVTNPQTGEKLPFIEANVFSNKNQKGKEISEIVFNSYSGIDKTAIYSRGFQLITENGKQTLFAYDSYDGISFSSGHEYEWGDKFLTDIDGKTYGVALDGKYEVSKIDGWKLGRTIGFLGLNLIFEGTDFKTTEEVKYTFTDFLNYITQMVKSSSAGTGDSIISLADLGNYLHIYDQDSGKPVGDNTLINSYFTIKVHFDNRGLTMAKQSLFGSVANDSSFNISGITDDKDYWKDTTTINLTEKHFTVRHVEEKQYLTLNLELVKSLSNYENLEVEININANDFDGLDFYALCGLESITKLNIYATELKDFEILNGALKDTILKFEDITTSNINLINLEVAIDD